MAISFRIQFLVVLSGLLVGLVSYPAMRSTTAGAQSVGQPRATVPVNAGLSARGLVLARNQSQIGTDLVARVERLPFRAGERFSAGDELVGFDCRRYHAELAGAEAEKRAAALTVKSNEEMRQHGAMGLTELEISKAKLEVAAAQSDMLAVRTAQCSLRAPYDGRVVDLGINEHETPSANTPLIRIVDDRNLEIDVLVPSTWLSWLRTGSRLTFAIDETRQDYEAAVKQVGAAVDPISQTVRLRAVFKAAPADVLPGMSGTATFEQLNG